MIVIISKDILIFQKVFPLHVLLRKMAGGDGWG